MRIRRPVIYTAVSAAAIATAGLLASPAMASTTQFPYQGQGFSLYNGYGSAYGTATGNNQYQHPYGQNGQWNQYGQDSVSVSGTVRSNGYRYGRGTTEVVFLSSNSWSRGQEIGSAGPGQSRSFSGTVSNTNTARITLCAANQWGGNVRDCTSTTVTVNNQQHFPYPGNH